MPGHLPFLFVTDSNANVSHARPYVEYPPLTGLNALPLCCVTSTKHAPSISAQSPLQAMPDTHSKTKLQRTMTVLHKREQ